MSKRVLLIANDCTTIINFRMELLQALVSEGHIVMVALPNNERNKEIREMGCETIPLPILRKSKNPLKDIAIIKHIISIIDSCKPDIVFTFTIKPNVYGGIACAIRHIQYIPTITGLGTSIQNGGLLQKISLCLYRLGLKKAKSVFFQNSANKDFMFNNAVYSGPYEMIPGSGVNLDKFHIMQFPETEEINFIFVGRVMKDKGIEEFLAAAKYIKRIYPQCNFHIYGALEGEYESQLSKSEKTGIVVYHGMTQNMDKIYSFAHCIIHPSYHEGMANVLLECAACGRAIITTNVPGCREAVDDGVNGYIAYVRDTHSLVEKIEQFVKLPIESKKAMGIAGRIKMEKEFDRNIVIRTYLNQVN